MGKGNFVEQSDHENYTTLWGQFLGFIPKTPSDGTSKWWADLLLSLDLSLFLDGCRFQCPAYAMNTIIYEVKLNASAAHTGDNCTKMAVFYCCCHICWYLWVQGCDYDLIMYARMFFIATLWVCDWFVRIAKHQLWCEGWQFYQCEFWA